MTEIRPQILTHRFTIALAKPLCQMLFPYLCLCFWSFSYVHVSYCYFFTATDVFSL